MEWLKRRKRDKRGRELRHLVPAMLQYVADHYKPKVQYCVVPEKEKADLREPARVSYSIADRREEIKPVPPAASSHTSHSVQRPSSGTKYSLPADEDIKYSLPMTPEDDKPVINDMKKFAQDAERDMALYDSRALENTYHAWEKKNAELKSFSSEVVRMVKEKYRKTSDFYHVAGIDKRTWHKISTDFGYKPSRMTAMRCCIGLKLNAEEAEKLLKLAGMAFSPNDPDDLVLKFCLGNGIRDIPGVNYMLYRYANSK